MYIYKYIYITMQIGYLVKAETADCHSTQKPVKLLVKCYLNN